MDRCPHSAIKDCLNFKKEYERDRERNQAIRLILLGDNMKKLIKS